MNSNSKLIYRIDAQDRIVFVNDLWEEFALSNNGAETKSEKVLNQSLWDFICDEPTRQIYREILRQVRLNKSMVFNFRCDSPDYRRYLEMNIFEKDNEVQFEIRDLEIIPRKPQKLLDNEVARSDDFIAMCNWCKKINAGQEGWKEIEEVFTESDEFEDKPIPQLKHAICCDCFLKIGNEVIERANCGE